MRIVWYAVTFCMVVLCSFAVSARAGPLFGNGALPGGASPLFQASLPETSATGGSLFAGRAAHGLFAPRPDPVPDLPEDAFAQMLPGRGGPVAALRDLIAKAEAGPAGYNAVVWDAKVRPPRAPTALTLQQINDWIDDTPGQNHAIGRYQFIPATLRRLVARAGLAPQTPFSPQVQDKLADMLLVEAGLPQMLSGALPQTTFMQNLARIWAGLPMPSGKSFYDGVAGNKATMTWARYEAEMRRIFSS